jgi:hypothetical protein
MKLSLCGKFTGIAVFQAAIYRLLSVDGMEREMEFFP